MISNPPGCLRGVKKGDVLLEIGSRDVRNLSFQKTEELLKTTMKPVHLVFERTFRMSGEINFGMLLLPFVSFISSKHCAVGDFYRQ